MEEYEVRTYMNDEDFVYRPSLTIKERAMKRELFEEYGTIKIKIKGDQDEN